MKRHKIRSGYSIPLRSAPAELFSDAPTPLRFSVRPNEFHYVRPKLEVAEGDHVRIGSRLFFDKRRPDISFASPAAGKIVSIRYGPRRVVERIVIENGGDESEQFERFRPGEIGALPREELIALLLKAGMWPYIRQRPFDIIADPGSRPVAIFINCHDSAPLAADSAFALRGREAHFRAGVAAAKALCEQVHIAIAPGRGASGQAAGGASARNRGEPSIFILPERERQGVEYHTFSGPHPAGLVGTHIFHIEPLEPGRVVWFLNARDVVLLGAFLLTGQYPVERVVAVAGDGIRKPGYLRTRQGALAQSLLAHNLREGEQRIVSGNLLTGLRIEEEDNAGFYDDLLTVIPEGGERHFLGWLGPGFRKPTWSRAFLSAALPGRPLPVNTGKNGELRALVKTGDYSKVMAMDVLPDFLVKAILAEDIELMEGLGIYDVAPEDVALCSYICPSKVEFTEIIRKGLDMMLEEIS